MDGPHGNMIHSTVPPGMVGRACRFRTIDEYWFVLSGEGEIFQYRCTRDVPLVFTCTALPPWPGDDEAMIMDGPWVPSVDQELGASSSDQPTQHA